VNQNFLAEANIYPLHSPERASS